jgi:DNA-binding NarL/FixJ family response regulator
VPDVLIVDDHAAFRARARRLLEADGFDVVGEASDGREAIAAAERLKPDLVVLDVQLPDLDGFDVAARLAASGLDSVVVLTSNRSAADYAPLLTDTPARAFIPKAELSGAVLADLLPG